MGKAVGDSLPMAAAIALSPIPVIAVVLALTSRRAAVNGPAFVVGWLAGLAVVGVIVLALAGSSGAGKPGRASWLSWVEIVLGVLLLLVAIQQFRGRPRGGDEPVAPRWMATIDRTNPAAALGLGVVLVAANPKDLLLAVSGAAVIARTGIPGSEQAIAYVVFAVIGTLSVGIPVLMYVAMGERSQKLLLRLKDWMGQQGAGVVSALCVVIAAVLIGEAVAALTG